MDRKSPFLLSCCIYQKNLTSIRESLLCVMETTEPDCSFTLRIMGADHQLFSRHCGCIFAECQAVLPGHFEAFCMFTSHTLALTQKVDLVFTSLSPFDDATSVAPLA